MVKMFTSKFVSSLFMVLCAISGGSLKQIPDYIEVCKRDQSTINECVLKSIEKIRPKLAEGIPELQVPTIEPFVIPQIVVDSGNVVQFVAIGQDVKVSGASNFTIKNIDVDLDTFTIRGRVRFPRLHFDGRYTLDARVLVLPLKGQGNILADAGQYIQGVAVSDTSTGATRWTHEYWSCRSRDRATSSPTRVSIYRVLQVTVSVTLKRALHAGRTSTGPAAQGTGQHPRRRGSVYTGCCK
ncbi:unnamed protein product [Plutella xylostella]|uniref:(diamondback moth) hypothetical protein n=1 Tax=Plutella xylostella TaxID=51655 RepID=A0A8S4E0I9_PLUXY|nr:unnamed protein product [Plutella xylostella]